MSGDGFPLISKTKKFSGCSFSHDMLVAKATKVHSPIGEKSDECMVYFKF